MFKIFEKLFEKVFGKERDSSYWGAVKICKACKSQNPGTGGSYGSYCYKCGSLLEEKYYCEVVHCSNHIYCEPTMGWDGYDYESRKSYIGEFCRLDGTKIKKSMIPLEDTIKYVMTWR